MASAAKRTKRLKLAAAKIEKYFLDKNLHATLTRLYGKDGREMWKAYISACKDDQDDQATSERKINIMASTILSSVGFGISSVSKYKAFLDTENTAIEPDDDRISEAAPGLPSCVNKIWIFSCVLGIAGLRGKSRRTRI